MFRDFEDRGDYFIKVVKSKKDEKN